MDQSVRGPEKEEKKEKKKEKKEKEKKEKKEKEKEKVSLMCESIGHRPIALWAKMCARLRIEGLPYIFSFHIAQKHTYV